MATTQNCKMEVRGDAELHLPPERALLSVKLQHTSTDKAKTAEAILNSTRKVEHLLRNVNTSKDGQVPAVDYWSRTSLVESWKDPYDSRKEITLPREYSAEVSFDIRLQRFNQLGPWIRDVTAIEHVQSKGVEWVLTSATKEAQGGKLRALAAKNGLSKAHDYAAALGYSKVTAYELDEGHSYVRSSNRKAQMMRQVEKQRASKIETQSRNMVEGDDWEDLGEDAFQYTPEEVKMSQTVTIKFQAE